MPRARIQRGRAPGTRKIGKGTATRYSVPPQPPSMSTQFVPDAPQAGTQAARPGTQPKAAQRTFKSVPGEPAYMAEGGVIDGITQGVGEPVVKGIEFMHDVIWAAEKVYWLLGNNQDRRRDLKAATQEVGTILESARGRLQ